jgi:hypothetical protein
LYACLSAGSAAQQKSDQDAATVTVCRIAPQNVLLTCYLLHCAWLFAGGAAPSIAAMLAVVTVTPSAHFNSLMLLISTALCLPVCRQICAQHSSHAGCCHGCLLRNADLLCSCTSIIIVHHQQVCRWCCAEMLLEFATVTPSCRMQVTSTSFCLPVCRRCCSQHSSHAGCCHCDTLVLNATPLCCLSQQHCACLFAGGAAPSIAAMLAVVTVTFCSFQLPYAAYLNSIVPACLQEELLPA